MLPLVAALDTCALIPSRLRDILLDTADAGIYQCRWSEEVLNELYRTLRKNGRADAAAIERYIDHLCAAFPDATVPAAAYGELLPSLANDPKERHVLAAAIVARAQLIVTDNLRDFPVPALRAVGIEVQTPDAFLIDLWEDQRERMLTIVREQAWRYHRPSMTLHELLDRLQKSVPAFAMMVRKAAEHADC